MPAWAALFVEGARLLREGGWLGNHRTECPAMLPAAECAECPACAPLLSCQEADLSKVVALTLVVAVCRSLRWALDRPAALWHKVEDGARPARRRWGGLS